MIKVVSVISDTNIGGAGKILLSYLKKYDQSRFITEVAVPKGSALLEELAVLGIKTVEFSHISDKSFCLRGVWELLRYFQEARPDIVHTHAVLSARVAARLYGKCKIVHTRHSVFDQPAYKKRFPVKQLGGYINNLFSDVILAVSPAARDNITETGTNPQKVRVVFNGIDPQTELDEIGIAEERKTRGFQKEDFICAVIARLEEVKGHRYLIEAFKILSEIDPSVKLLIAGTGSCENSLKEMAKGCGNIVFSGFVKEVYRIENIMDLQLNASYGTEATSLSLLEGMSLGKPAVASDFGGNPYVIENGLNGLIVEKKNPQVIADAVLKLKEDKELFRQLSEGAKHIFKEKFTLDSMSRNIEKQYYEVLNRRGEGN